NKLSPDIYGIWTQVSITTSLLLAFVTLGFETSVVRFISGKKDPTEISSLFHLMLTIVIFNGILFLIASFFFRDSLSNFIFSDTGYNDFVFLTCLWLVVKAIYSINTA